MRRVIVRYKVKADRVAEHERLIHSVFDELTKAAPSGIRYGAFKQSDGVSFVHTAFIDAERNPLEAIAAFKAFTAAIAERCDESPKTEELTAVGVYEL
jgi:hypothetical protein